MTPTPPSPLTREAGLDALKAATTLLVVWHHTALTYGGPGSWFYRELPMSDSPSSLLLTFFCALNQAWFMGLFFFIAGYFTPRALASKGVAGFVRDRLLRLGVPLLVFGFVLGPVTVAMAHSNAEHGFVEVLMRLWQRGAFYSGPLWFVQALLVFSAGAVLWQGLRPGPTTPRAFASHRGLLAAALLCGAVAFGLRLVWPIGDSVWNMQPGHFASYVILFVTGCVAQRQGWPSLPPEALMRRWRRIALVTLPLMLPIVLLAPSVPWLHGRPEGGASIPALAFAFWEPFVAWGVILWLLRFFQTRVPATQALWQQLSRRAYAVFVIHPVVLVGVALAWRGVAAPPLLKFALTGAVTCAVCLGLAGALLRVPGLRRVL